MAYQHWRLLLVTVALASVVGSAQALGSPDPVSEYIAHYRAGRELVLTRAEIPSFSRQTGFGCNVCHTSFPQLTAFGRDFKLNGYTMATQQKVEVKDSARSLLQLNLIPPLSAMLLASVTNTNEAQPEAQNTNADFPQELGLFIGGAITPHLGGFVQLTYDPAEGGVAIDNVDIRLAYRTTVGTRPFTYGFTLNNNPTVQDAWNTVPAWGYPFTSSAGAPTPAGATLIDGGLSQQVAGLGGYFLWNDLLYGEFAAYRSAPNGAPNPPDVSSENTVHALAPYWRAALQRRLGPHYIEVGTYGLMAKLVPSGISGATNRFIDLALDAQYEVPLLGGMLVGHATWIHEQQRLDAAFADGSAANARNTLRTFRVDGSFISKARIAVTAGFLTTSGDADTGLYPPESVTGSRTGSPNSTGFIGELSLMPWLNTRFAAQYVLWTKFNGSSDDYDGSGRGAQGNSTLYLCTWLVF